MKIRSLFAAALIGAVYSSALHAAVSAEQAARLGADLTPVGAERAGNADGSIPAWDGKEPRCRPAGNPVTTIAIRSPTRSRCIR